MRLYLVRHGETDHNKNGIIMGHLPTPLNETGIKQSEILAQELKGKNIQKIYSSDLVRTIQTAEIISSLLNLEINYDPSLREHTVGELDGSSVSDLLGELDNLDKFDDLMVKFNGEITRDFMNRVWNGFKKIAKDNVDLDNVLIITHGGCIRTVIARILKGTEIVFDRMRVDNCCINIIEYAEKEGKDLFTIQLVNDMCHFKNE